MIKNHVAILGNCKSDYFSLQIALGPTFLFLELIQKITDGVNGADSNAGAGTTGTTGTDSGSSGSWLMAVPTPEKIGVTSPLLKTFSGRRRQIG